MIEWPYQDGRGHAIHGNPLFGEGWRDTPRGRDDTVRFVDPPVGEECYLCEEEIAEGDEGELMLALEPGVLKCVAQHRECTLLMIFGHDLGLCSCTGYGGLTFREAALETARRKDRQQS